MTAKILVVCTGNICRSPMAEGLLRAGAGVVGLDAKIASAGTWQAGVAADPHAVEAMAERGIDISAHRSHLLTEVDIEAADLILGMAREHAVAIAGQVPDAFDRTFTLRDFVDRALAAGPKPPALPLDGYLTRLNRGRSHGDLLRADATMDVADPLGLGRRAFDRCAAELERLVWATVDLLAGYPPRD